MPVPAGFFSYSKYDGPAASQHAQPDQPAGSQPDQPAGSQPLAAADDATDISMSLENLMRVYADMAAAPPSRSTEVVPAAAVAVIQRLVQTVRTGRLPDSLRMFTDDQRTVRVNVTAPQAALHLNFMAFDSPLTCKVIADAGGARALVRLLTSARNSTSFRATAAAAALLTMVQCGQAAAVAAADPGRAVEAMVQQLPQLPYFQDASPRLVSRALQELAAVRVCAAAGCQATDGLRQCKGCGSVRYCGEACMRAHWREHRPKCKQLRAEAVAGGLPVHMRPGA